MSAPKDTAYMNYKSLTQITLTNKYMLITYAVIPTPCSHFLLLMSKQAMIS